MIYNIQSSYAVGDELRINCTLYDYRPLRLYWLVNGQLVSVSSLYSLIVDIVRTDQIVRMAENIQ